MLHQRYWILNNCKFNEKEISIINCTKKITKQLSRSTVFEKKAKNPGESLLPHHIILILYVNYFR